ncbi:MAG: RNA polymerase factor sigma-54 [Gammaproteobacteria bacterium]|nr:MAG: RNA polymerase factor sigma-54 [Gammaproteobacteria bacterium]
MKQTIQLRIGQQLTMTPQLQQAIRLLQLSTLELQSEVQNVLESNPMLEQEEDDSREAEDKDDAQVNSAESGDEAGLNGTDVETPLTAENADSIPDDLAVDSNWDDIYDSGTTIYSAPSPEDRRDALETFRVNSEGLHEHLYWQLDLTSLSEIDRIIAHTLVDTIDDDGFLTQSLESIHEQLTGKPGSAEDPLDISEVEAVLHRIQQFDPVGVGARDLGESLHLQLRQYDPATPWLKDANILIREHLNLLACRDYNQLCRRMGLTRDDLQHVVHLIQSLNPRPGSKFNNMEPEYITPDVFVTRHKGQWRVELNTESIPKLRINNLYAGMIKRANNSKENTYLRDNLQEARWFLKSLQSRHDTLLKVANSIVTRQHAFFDYGEEAMKPMVLRSIAEEVDMHESTISRVTTRKYMHTPRGIYEFKYFFSSHVSTEAGGECSATAIRAIIKKLVAAESPVKPLSDSKMADILAKQGIKVARRTIAKYRESLSISPSNERKRLA